MNQFRFTNKGKKFLNRLYIKEEQNYEDVINNIPQEDIVPFVQLMDEYAEDWDITENLFIYFAEQILEGIKEEDDLFSIKVKNKINKLYEAIRTKQ